MMLRIEDLPEPDFPIRRTFFFLLRVSMFEGVVRRLLETRAVMTEQLNDRFGRTFDATELLTS